MSTKTATKNYLLPGNPVIDFPVERVGNLLYDERGEVVHRKLNERFPNTRGITDTHKYKPGDPISFSNIPRAQIRAQILREENNGEIQLLDPFQMVEYWDKFPDKAGTYADTSAVSVFPNPGPNENLRIRVLDILGRDPTKLEVPLLVQ
ncbi:MAG: hypothetical protein ABIB47_04300, partial [Candidatus Woesearchaeota archaeon]